MRRYEVSHFIRCHIVDGTMTVLFARFKNKYEYNESCNCFRMSSAALCLRPSSDGRQTQFIFHCICGFSLAFFSRFLTVTHVKSIISKRICIVPGCMPWIWQHMIAHNDFLGDSFFSIIVSSFVVGSKITPKPNACVTRECDAAFVQNWNYASIRKWIFVCI